MREFECPANCPECGLPCNGIGFNSHHCDNNHEWQDEDIKQRITK